MKWECNGYDMTMYEWIVSLWNENEYGMWIVVETECNGYNMKMCTMVCANEMWMCLEQNGIIMTWQCEYVCYDMRNGNEKCIEKSMTLWKYTELYCIYWWIECDIVWL